MIKKITATFFFFCILLTSSIAQELNCAVTIKSDAVSNVDKRVFETLRTSILEFMNNTKWTGDIYKTDERLECSIFINIVTALSVDEFKGTIQVQSRRTAYKTSYPSTMLNYNDEKFTFKYVENQTLEFNPSTFSSNLTSILAFYAYMIIGIDYDSYSLEGGTPYYQKAQQIVTNSQNDSRYEGWKAFEGTKNRYWFVENMLNPNFKPLRATIYKYHRLGLDIMATDLEAGRKNIYESIENLQKVFNTNPLSFLMNIFFTAKSDEIINIFSQSFGDMKAKIAPILSNIDPGNSNKYLRIQNSN